MNDRFQVGIRSHTHRSVYKTAGRHIFESAEWRSEAVKSVICARRDAAIFELQNDRLGNQGNAIGSLYRGDDMAGQSLNVRGRSAAAVSQRQNVFRRDSRACSRQGKSFRNAGVLDEPGSRQFHARLPGTVR